MSDATPDQTEPFEPPPPAGIVDADNVIRAAHATCVNPLESWRVALCGLVLQDGNE
jgi:hypothetical protein